MGGKNFIKQDNNKYKVMKYSENKMQENTNSDRKEYDLLNNNCGTFAKDVINQDSKVAKDAPVVVDPRPNSMVKEYQEKFEPIKYNPEKD